MIEEIEMPELIHFFIRSPWHDCNLPQVGFEPRSIDSGKISKQIRDGQNPRPLGH